MVRVDHGAVRVRHAAAGADVTVAILGGLGNAAVEGGDDFAQAVEVVEGVLDYLSLQ